jgi:hypothetical protein
VTDQPEDQGPLSAEAAAMAADELAAHAAAAPSPAADQAATAAAMTERGPTLPMEEQIEQYMETMKAQLADMATQISVLKKQQADTVAGQGTPMVVRYAQGAADKIAALAVAHPDAPQHHFGPLKAAAGKLAEEAQKLNDGSGSLAALKDVTGAVEKFAARTHWKTWGKHIDFSMILSDVEDAIEAGEKLAAVA